MSSDSPTTREDRHYATIGKTWEWVPLDNQLYNPWAKEGIEPIYVRMVGGPNDGRWLVFKNQSAYDNWVLA